ncbi:MAG TPA: hypothetical protein EYP33_07415, partial [Pyrodictium sp.]|nr:hypothetical protein [Pyrodictium sp.]
MIPELAVFIDGLKPESVEYMEFLNTLNLKRIKTELINYSNTCHASIYTGVYPNKHKIQFIWKYSPNTSPFKFLRKFKIHKIPCSKTILKLIYHSITHLKGGKNVYGAPYLLNIPVDKWSLFDFDVVKHWGKPNTFLGEYPTIFGILERNNVDYSVIWALKNSISIIKKSFSQLGALNYIFIGELDPLSHKFGQNSPEVRNFLQ